MSDEGGVDAKHPPPDLSQASSVDDPRVLHWLYCSCTLYCMVPRRCLHATRRLQTLGEAQVMKLYTECRVHRERMTPSGPWVVRPPSRFDEADGDGHGMEGFMPSVMMTRGKLFQSSPAGPWGMCAR